jgi:DNA topoisomerase-1
MPLVVIESPNKIAKLKKILGGGFTIMATKGHVMDLPPKSLGVDVKNDFAPEYETISGKGSTLKEIAAEAKNHDTIYLATDPDREGEAIAAHVASELPKRGKIIRRVRFHAITKPAVDAAIANAGQIDTNLYDAQQARRVTDRLVGYQVSPVMWRKGIKGASAGRVQSVALKYVVEREREIRAFVPEEYWDIDAVTTLGFKARLWGVDGKNRTIKDEKTSSAIKRSMEGAADKHLRVASVEYKRRERRPDAPFTTSSLQQAANNVLGWGVDKTMTVAQHLFEKGVITYHRTDSVHIEPEKIASLREQILGEHGADYLPSKPNEYKSGKSSQEAHEAIRPTGDEASSLDGDETRLLDLIAGRFMASQMKSAEFEQASVEFEYLAGKTVLNFRANGSRLLFDGFLKVYGSATEDLVLPELAEGQRVPYTIIETVQKFTQPPSRYSDAALVKQMEKDGVGRPATYASIIKTLLNRNFVVKDKRTFAATEFGEIVYDYLTRFFPELVNPEFTAKMEESLDSVAEGKTSYVCALRDFYDPFAKTLAEAKKGDIKELLRTEHMCPGCGEGYLLKRRGQDGKSVFFACERHPQCKTIAAQNEDGSLKLDAAGRAMAREKKADAPVEEGPECPKCGSKTVKRSGRFGDFYGCTAWKETKCNGIVNIDKRTGEVARPEVYRGVLCSKCSRPVLKKTGKFGDYLVCSDADCKTTMGIPVGICPNDGGFVTEKYSKKKKKKFFSCLNWPRCEFATDHQKDFHPLRETS